MAEEAGGMVLQLLRAFTVTDVRTGCHRVLSADSSQLPTSLPGTAASLIAWHPQLFLDPTMVPPSQVSWHPANLKGFTR